MGVTRRFQRARPDETAAWLESPAIDCSLDVLTDAGGAPRLVFPRNTSVGFGGWIADPKRGRIPGFLAIVLVGRDSSLAEDGPGRPRPDVAKAFDAPPLETAGFVSTFERHDTPAGRYHIWLLGFIDGKVRACNSKKALRIQ